jgi:hypothetical protein
VLPIVCARPYRNTSFKVQTHCLDPGMQEGSYGSARTSEDRSGIHNTIDLLSTCEALSLSRSIHSTLDPPNDKKHEYFEPGRTIKPSFEKNLELSNLPVKLFTHTSPKISIMITLKSRTTGDRIGPKGSSVRTPYTRPLYRPAAWCVKTNFKRSSSQLMGCFKFLNWTLAL